MEKVLLRLSGLLSSSSTWQTWRLNSLKKIIALAHHFAYQDQGLKESQSYQSTNFSLQLSYFSVFYAAN